MYSFHINLHVTNFFIILALDPFISHFHSIWCRGDEGKVVSSGGGGGGGSGDAAGGDAGGGLTLDERKGWE